MLFSTEPERWRVSYFSDITKQINSHYFSKRIECFFPGLNETSTPPSLKQCQETLCSSQYFYYTVRCPLSAILTQDFINRYIRTKGTHRFYALSCPEEYCKPGTIYPGQECQSLANRFAILPSGKLIMSLDRETYQQLGLEGSSPKYEKFGNNKDGERRIVIDISASSFVPGKPLHDRVLWCLSPDRTSEIAFNCCYINTVTGISEEIEFGTDVIAERKCLSVREETINEVLQPTLKSLMEVPSNASKGSQSNIRSLHLWAGLLATRSDPVVNYRRYELGDFISIGDAKTSRRDDYLTRVGDETVTYARDTARCIVASGFIPDVTITKLIEGMNMKEGGKERWGTVMSWGFSNGPVSWGDGCEHSDFLGGDNNMIVFTGAEKPFGMCVISPHDTF